MNGPNPSPYAPAHATPPGVLDGIGALLGAMRFVLFRPASYPHAAVPIITAAVLMLVLGFSGAYGAGKLAPWVAARFVSQGVGAIAATWLLTLLLVVLSLVIAVLLALALAQPLSGWALEALSRAQEEELTGVRRADDGFVRSAMRGLRVSLAALLIGTPVLIMLFVLGVLVPVAAPFVLAAKFIVSSVIVAWDFLDYPLSLRAMGVRARLAWIREHLGAAVGFGAACTALLLIPFVGLLVLPVGAVGATRLVLRAEGVGKRA